MQVWGDLFLSCAGCCISEWKELSISCKIKINRVVVLIDIE